MEFRYFNLLEIPVSFRPVLALLKKNYYRLSRDVHPDYFTNEPLVVQEAKLKQSGELNAAFKTLSDQSQRTEYILNTYGLLNDGDNTTLSQEFLMEMMEINESLFELQIQFHPQQFEELLQQISEKQTRLDSELSTFFAKYDIGIDQEQALNEILDNYLKSRYLLRIQQNISTFAPS